MQGSTGEDMNYQNVKDKLDILERQYDFINDSITENLKVYDEILNEDKDTHDKIKRNLDDIKTIFVNDLEKFDEAVEIAIKYNEALYTRLEKDSYYLRDDQENLRRKMLRMEKRISDMEEQIGNGL